MCGIFGVTGSENAIAQTYTALDRMSYRGYDSAGIAAVGESGLDRRRAAGRIAALGAALEADPLAGPTAIGHTRWATHGAATEGNAHPHLHAGVGVVHNGILENHVRLRATLADDGYTPDSDTDSELAALLVARERARGRAPMHAVRAAIREIEGAFAFAFVFADHPDTIVVARRGSPLAIGVADDAAWLGSDALALGAHCGTVHYLEDGDIAVLRPGEIRIQDAGGRDIHRPSRDISAVADAADKDGHPHFMHKEIFEQPATAQAALDAHLVPAAAPAQGRTFADALARLDFTGIDRILMVACGTSHYACMIARYWLEELAGLPVEVDIASEACGRQRPVGPSDLGIFVSQSGETADTHAALVRMRTAGARTLALVNVAESNIARDADSVLELHAGPEIGVASTKAFTAQLIVLALVAARAAADRGALSARDEILDALADLPAAIEATLQHAGAIARLGERLARARSAFFLGRGPLYPLALEGALKLKEISYIHAEGQAAGELKHGPLALIEPATPTVVLAHDPAHRTKTLSNAAEVAARGGPVILSCTPAEALDIDALRLPVPDAAAFLAPFTAAVALQLLAYHAAAHLGHDIDKPRNLAKSVTVA